MKPDQALIALGLLPGGISPLPETVRAAYAACVKANHPDHGGDGTLIAKLKEARDVLLQNEPESHSEIITCKLCGGSGKVKLRFGAQTCTACGGSGDQRR